MGKSKDLAGLGGGELNKNLTVTDGTNAMHVEVRNGTNWTGRFAAPAVGTSAIQYYNGSNWTNGVEVDASGRVTMPYQSGFRAYLNTNYTHPSGQVNLSSAWGGLGYWSKSFDNQNNFSTSTGLFTAPVTGMYSFSAGLNGNSSSNNITYFSCEFLVNGGRKSIHWFGNIKSGSSSYSAANNASVFKLSAGDTVGLYCELNSSEILIGSSADVYSFFSGYLIG